eukprot:TRINITY_DN6745_c0_g1_i5.p1 TRINITY_DN6745_c0_g1~~TRINITY_DN6745_c0_g1_i5.p1  ORF type:complete len:958 (-),score=393.88 TRINITY_DN6745_c0_g1_i5:230-3103(-)
MQVVPKMATQYGIKWEHSHVNEGSSPLGISFHPSGNFLTTFASDQVIVRSIPEDGAKLGPIVSTVGEKHTTFISFNFAGDASAHCIDGEKEVKVYDCKSMQEQKLVETNFKLNSPPVISTFSPNNAWIVATSGNGETKRISRHDKSVEPINHEGVVRWVGFDPQTRYLTTAGRDKAVRIWKVNDDFAEVHKFENQFSESQISKNGHFPLTLSWEPSGNFLAIPGKEFINVVNDSWKTIVLLEGGHKGPIGITSWSPNGMYLASVSMEKERGTTASFVTIWNMDSKKAIHSFIHPKIISGVSWNPKANSLALIDCNGSVGLWNNVIPGHLTPSFQIVEEKEVVEQPKPERIRKEVDYDSDDALNDIELNEKRMEEERDAKEEEEEAEPMDFADRLMLKYSKPKNAEEEEGDEEEEVSTRKAKHKLFQIGDTKLTNKKRYMAFNTTGQIVLSQEKHNEDVTQNSIQIDFINSERRPIKFLDESGIFLGALGEKGALFASKKNGDNPPTITYYPTESSSTKKWTYSFDDDDEPQLITVCHDYAVVYSSQGVLTLFGRSGYILGQMNFPQNAVTLCGSANTHHFMFVYEELGLLFYVYVNAQTFKVVESGRLNISKGSKLTWAGFSDTGMPAVCDSTRKIAVLTDKLWMNVGIVPKNHWLFGLSSDDMRTLIIRDDQREPSVMKQKRETRPLHLLYSSSTDLPSVKLVETAVRTRLFVENEVKITPVEDEELEKKRGRVSLAFRKIFLEALKSDHMERCLEFASFIEFAKVYDDIIAAANKANRSILVKQLIKMKEDKFPPKEEEEEEEEVKPTKVAEKKEVTTPAKSERPKFKPLVGSPSPVKSANSSPLKTGEESESEGEGEEEEDDGEVEDEEEEEEELQVESKSPAKSDSTTPKKRRFSVEAPTSKPKLSAQETFKLLAANANPKKPAQSNGKDSGKKKAKLVQTSIGDPQPKKRRL